MNDVERLRAVIRRLHVCESLRVGSVAVPQIAGEMVVSKERVEVFALEGHPQATRAYAWTQVRRVLPDMRRSASARASGRLAFAVTFALALATGSVRPAAAMRACGDHVPGHRMAVPCRCGDMLVSSRTLQATDLVTRESCRGTGLVVRAPGPVTLAFDGRTITGQGQGVGVLVVGGSLSLTGPGVIEGFGVGAHARGPTAVASVVGMRFRGNRLAGLSVDSNGYAVQGSVAEGNGRDGFALGGTGYALDGNRATGNGRYGFYLLGMGAHVGGGLGNEATENQRGGFWLYGMLHEVVGATAVENGEYGFFAMGMHTLLSGIHAAGNEGVGLRGMGMALALEGNTATGNSGFGIWVSGGMLDDRGGNAGADNVGLMGAASIEPTMLRATAPDLIQCRIGTAACR